ncbi:hypothetical protein FHS29_005771 [Saccharothrix tamanrassetensis]|uniref:PE family protein n=1 Tax=Saccharothrix tamanrassetensis TaxID=1051531 RepID=A0A841CNC6_9PSEU|nr:hypothetical protein [Saccharothrix tamanrassetensis]MBB5959151.1 hypothetical protein [Saccharothrix tamanrassetensis]
MERVRGIEDAKRLRDELDDDRPRRHAPLPPAVAPPAGVGAIVPQDGDRIELDFSDLNDALGKLDRLHSTLYEHLDRADVLSQPFGDGKGPVALHMRRAFGLRAGEMDGGVKTALKSYLRELELLRDALRQVGATHQAEDEAVAEAMRKL